MARARRIARRVAVALAGVLFVATGLLAVLDRTAAGHRWARDVLVSRMGSAVDGTLQVDEIRSESLASGVTLSGIRVRGPSGRAILEVDSILARYSLRGLLSGDVVLSRLTLWRPRVVVSRFPGEEGYEAATILRPGTERPAAPRAPPGEGRTIAFRDVSIRGGSVEVLVPATEAEARWDDQPGEPTIQDGDFRRWLFSFDGELDEAVVSSPSVAGPRVAISSLSLTGEGFRAPLVVSSLKGQLSWSDGSLEVIAEELTQPSSQARGRISAAFGGDDDGSSWSMNLELSTKEYALSDLRWIEPDLPDYSLDGTFTVMAASSGAFEFGFTDGGVTAGESRLVGEGMVRIHEELTFEDVDIEVEAFRLSRLEPFMANTLPLDGLVRGRLRLDGPLRQTRARGRLTLSETTGGHRPATAEFQGIIDLTTGALADMATVLDPFDYSLVSTIVPGFRLAGPGRAELRGTGSIGGGLRIRADLSHAPAGLPPSRLLAEGSLRRSDDGVVMDIQADLSPLSLTALEAYYGPLPVRGPVSGAVRAVGPTRDLVLRTNLLTEAGAIALESRLDLRDLGAFYRVEGEVSDFVMSRVVPSLPQPSTVSGELSFEGSGLDASTARIRGRLNVPRARLGRVDVDSVEVVLRVADGKLALDSARAVVGGIDIEAHGSLAINEADPLDEVELAFQTDSLDLLRQLFTGDDVVARPTLDPLGLEAEVLRLEGIDPDTLPLPENVRVAGRVQGSATLRGSLRNFAARGSARFEGLRYGTDVARSVGVVFSADALPDLAAGFEARFVADSIQARGLSFRSAEADLSYRRTGGRAELFLSRSDSEEYRARMGFRLDSLGAHVDLDELSLRFDSVRWQIDRPATFDWDDRGILVGDLTLRRPDVRGVRIDASGLLASTGPSDFRLDGRGLPLDRLARFAQREDLEATGTVDLSLRVRGTASEPVMEGSLLARDVHARGYGVDVMEGDLGYVARRLTLDLRAMEDDRLVLAVTGSVPADLALKLDVEPSFPDDPLDLSVVADSIPASLFAGLIRDFSDVEGIVSGTFEVGGTLDSPAPRGSLVLTDAAWTVTPIGVRYEGVRGTLLLRPDGTVEVDASMRAGGTAVVGGTAVLEPLSNPTLDLQITFDDFRVVDRRDVLGDVSGDLTITGSYQRPLLQGTLEVQEGVLFLEEFQRAATVVDLSDPRFFNVVDTTLLAARPILAASQNPFMQNLRMFVDLRVTRDTWLRSEDMNVEIGGQLFVTYDRQSRDLVLVGELQAVRGSYTVASVRRFQVQEGTLEFVGIPGINPDLDIAAVARVRRTSRDPLDVRARVTGSLIDPRVELSSDEAAIGESDLLSYLVFGRPTAQLASREAGRLQDVGEALLGDIAGAASSVFSGTVAARLSALAAQQWGLDYFSINQLGEFGAGGHYGLEQTQVEVGRYLGDDLFWVLVLQPGSAFRSADLSQVFGARLEWTAPENYTVQAFWEDRFLRSRVSGFRELGVPPSKILGFSLFWNWSY